MRLVIIEAPEVQKIPSSRVQAPMYEAFTQNSLNYIWFLWTLRVWQPTQQSQEGREVLFDQVAIARRGRYEGAGAGRGAAATDVSSARQPCEDGLFGILIPCEALRKERLRAL